MTAVSLWLSWFAGELSPVAFSPNSRRRTRTSFMPLVQSNNVLNFDLDGSSNACLLLCVSRRVTKRPPTPQKRWPSRTPQPSTLLPHRMASPQSLRHRTRSRHRTTPGRAGFLSTPWPSTRPHRRTASRPALTTARLPSPPPRPHRSVSFITCKHCSQHAVSK